MKTLKLMAVLFCLTSLVFAAEPQAGYVSESKVITEIFTSKILKVYTFQEEEMDYTAYVVTWKEHEVVVVQDNPFMNEPKPKVGDLLRCTATQTMSRKGDKTSNRISFRIDHFSGLNARDEAKRLEAFLAEVSARRERRMEMKNAKSAETDEPAGTDTIKATEKK